MNCSKINHYISANPSKCRNRMPKYIRTILGNSQLKFCYKDDEGFVKLDLEKIEGHQKRLLQQITDKSPTSWETNALINAKQTDICKLCGECADWCDDIHPEKQEHTKKNCPYAHYYDVKDYKTYKILMMKIEKFNQTPKANNDYEKEILELKEKNEKLNELVAKKAERVELWRDKYDKLEEDNTELKSAVKLAENQLASTFASLDKEKENTKIYKDCFSLEEIKKRKENYAMEKEQMAMMNAEMETKELAFKERELKLVIKEKEIEEMVKVKTEKANLTITAYKQREDRRDKQIEYYRNLYENSNQSINNIKTYLSKSLEDNKVLLTENVKIRGLMEQQYKENNVLEDRLDKYLLTNDKQDNYEGQNCSICIENIDDGKGTTTECGHHFHTKCYTSFIKLECQTKDYGKICCPNCRNHLINIT